MIQNIHWTIQQGEHWLVSGAINSGKTTLLKLIGGQGRLWQGQISYPHFTSIHGTVDRFKAIKMVSFTDNSHLFHNANAVHYYQQRYHATESEGHLTVAEYLQSGGLDLNHSWHQEVLDFFHLHHLLTFERIKLSSGQTRKMLLARVLLSAPLLLLLDQPYMGMDTDSRIAFNQLLDALVQRFDLTVIVAADHDQLPACITNHFLLQGGSGTVIPFKKNKTLPISASCPIPARLIDIYHTQSKTPDYHFALRCVNVQVKYGAQPVLADFNWEVQAGEKWAVFGPNGAGKSTLLALLYGDHPQAYANEIFLFDRRRGSGESIWDIKRRTGFTSPEVHAFFRAGQTAKQLILTGLDDKWVFHGQTNAFAPDLLLELLSYFGLKEYAGIPFSQLSTGTQRLLFFIRALIKVPNLLLLDEPFQGLDWESIEKAKQLLCHLLDDRHNLIFITHYSSEIPGIVGRQLRLALPQN